MTALHRLTCAIDTVMNGNPCGALTFAFVNAIQQAKMDLTWKRTAKVNEILSVLTHPPPRRASVLAEDEPRQAALDCADSSVLVQP